MAVVGQIKAPAEITATIIDVCRELVGDGRPLFVDITPRADAAELDCFPVVERQVVEHGGEVVYGWRFWEQPGVIVEAEFHAVWRDRYGRLHDVTPTPYEGVNRILFVPDPVRVYEGRQVDNVRRALTDRPEVRELIAAAEAEFQIMNRGERATQHGAVTLNESEMRELFEIRGRKARALAALTGVTLPIEPFDYRPQQPARAPKLPGRNQPCYCGSGKKFKKCHGG